MKTTNKFVASTLFLTTMLGSTQINADVPITKQSYDFLKIEDNQGVVTPTLSRMASVNAGVKSISSDRVPPDLYRGGTPVSRPNCGLDNSRDWGSISLARNAIEDCFSNSTYNQVQQDLAYLIEQTGARSGHYNYTEPVTINGEDRYFQVGVFLRANQSASQAKRVGISISPSESARNIYAIYENPKGMEPIGEEMLMQGAGSLKIYTMEGLDPDEGIELIHTENSDDFAVSDRSADDYVTEGEQTFYDKSGAVEAINFIADYMDEYSSNLAILDYGNPISPRLDYDPEDPRTGGEATMPLVPSMEIETPERWYSRNECTMDNVTYGQRNTTELEVVYQRDRYVVNGDAGLAREARLETLQGRNITAVGPQAQINTIEDIFDFEAFRGEDPVTLSTEHLNAYTYDYNKPISDFENNMTDPYNEYSSAPNNLFQIGQDDPFNNIPASVFQTPTNVIDDSIVKVEYDVYDLVEDGYYSERSKPGTEEYESCKDVPILDSDGNDTGETKEECETKTRNITITETGKFDTTPSPWSYTNWVPPVYEKNVNTACIHNTQEENFCDTYNCEQTEPERDDKEYITDESVSQYQEESFYWTTDDWSGCDTNCGLGKETRSVSCVSTLGGSADSSNCTEPKPDSERPCQGSVENCSFEWKTTEWSKCSEVCDGGIRTREAFCQAPSGEKVPDNRCDLGQKPSEQGTCNTEACVYEYKVSNWSSCVSNASCMETGTRRVCTDWGGKGGPRCRTVERNNEENGRSRGWLNNQMTTLTGQRDDGFNGSHFQCSTSSTRQCPYGYSGSRTTTTIYGQKSRSVQCERTNDGGIVHIGYCGDNQPKTHKECVKSSSSSGSCTRDHQGRNQ